MVCIAVEGSFKLAFRDRVIDLSEGDMIVVSKGVEHKPICETGFFLTGIK